MQTGALTGYIDIAQLCIWAFWLFFAGLILYLRREDKREGYPLESDRNRRTGRVIVQGFPPVPRPKRFLLTHGGTYLAPGGNPERREIRSEPVAPFPGAPYQPTGNPLVDGVGPASYAARTDAPDLTFEGDHRIQPLRVATDYFVDPHDTDPRGMTVFGADDEPAGEVRELWVDRAEPGVSYLEITLAGSADSRPVLVPMRLARMDVWRRRINVQSILAHQFAEVPALKDPDSITRLEEDKILGYFAGGKLYAEPSRLFPAL